MVSPGDTIPLTVAGTGLVAKCTGVSGSTVSFTISSSVVWVSGGTVYSGTCHEDAWDAASLANLVRRVSTLDLFRVETRQEMPAEVADQMCQCRPRHKKGQSKRRSKDFGGN